MAHFRALLRIDTSNPPGREEPAAHYLASVLDREGIEYTMVEKAPGRTNLVARLRGNGAQGPLLLSGHLDVVPAEGQYWRYPPFAADEAEGCIWGRGAIDMKNMVAMSLMTLVALRRCGDELSRDVVFAAVADEEAGCGLGSTFLVDSHPELVRAEYVLNEVGGQTVHLGGRRFYPIQVAEKGACWLELVAIGEPGHGALPNDDSAVRKIAVAVERLTSARLGHRCVPEVKTFIETLARHTDGVTASTLRALTSPLLARFALPLLRRADVRTASTFSAMLANTVTPTMLEAGHAPNVVPSNARATVDGRVLPGVSVDAFLTEVRSTIGDTVTMNVIKRHDGVRAPVSSPLFEVIRSTLAQFDPGGVVVPYLNPGFTDSHAYARLGATCYGFSPVRLGPELNFAQMFHGHDERIPVSGYRWGQCALLYAVAAFCCSERPSWLGELTAENSLP